VRGLFRDNMSTGATDTQPLIRKGGEHVNQSHGERVRSEAEVTLQYTRVLALALALLLGVAQGIWAGIWRHWIGVLVGAVFLGVSCFALQRLLFVPLCCPHIHPAARGIFIALHVAIALLSAMFFVIYVLNQRSAPPDSSFPTSCKFVSNCVRLVLNDPNGTVFRANFSVPIYNNSVTTIQNTILPWLELFLNEDAVVFSNSTFTHAVFVTPFFAFADDFYTLISPYNGTYNAVQLQSNSRLGEIDLGDSTMRVNAFLQWMSARIV